RNLRHHVDEQGDSALSTLLGFLGVDESAHHGFFLRAVRLFLKYDRTETLRQLHRVLHGFSMPAIHELADGRRRVEAIQNLGLFDKRIYLECVYQPTLDARGISRQELRKAG